MTEFKTKYLELYNCDNMELMAKYEDNYFDLAIIDPPYGIGYSHKAGKESGKKYGVAKAKRTTYSIK